MSCRALAGGCSGAAALAGSSGAVLGRRNYLAPVLAALGAYGERFGHVRVPRAFVVPDADVWPEEPWLSEELAAISAEPRLSQEPATTSAIMPK